MNFRTRVFLTFLPLALLPLVGFAWLIRNELSNRVQLQFDQETQRQIQTVSEELKSQSTSVATSLEQIGNLILDDNQFRAGVVRRTPDDRSYVLDFARRAMNLAGLSVLQVQDSSGRILSSGHFRNEFDRIDRELPGLLATVKDTAVLTNIRTPARTQLSLVRMDSIRLAGDVFTLVGGRTVETDFLQRLSFNDSLLIQIVFAGGVVSSNVSTDTLVVPSKAGRAIEIPFVDPAEDAVTRAVLVVDRGTGELEDLRKTIDRRLAIAALMALVLIAIGVAILSARVSRPLAELVEKTALLDLNRLNVDFRTRKRDEVGQLAMVLGKLTRKLKTSSLAIRDAERRAAQGELARQVNHDIKNGLTPIKNVFSHLIEVAGTSPEELPEILKQRSSTIESSISYLSRLSANYAKLSPTTETIRCDIGNIASHVVEDKNDQQGSHVTVHAQSPAWIRADPLAIRRIFENLIDNAIDSLDGAGAVRVEIVTRRDSVDGNWAVATISDTGAGMEEETQQQIFEDFYTTKSNGTGLGLSIVRRLVLDAGGRIRFESQVGEGSYFTVEFPLIEDEP